MSEIVGKIPEFTQDGTSVQEAQQTEVKQEEKETLPETSTEEKPATEEVSEDTQEEPEILSKKKELEESLLGLSGEKEKILKDIQTLREERRNLRTPQEQNQPGQPITEKQVDELKDLHPDDVATIERVLRAKGYLSKPEFDKQLYNNVKQEELNKFLDKFPEYKPENDPEDRKWLAFQSELKFYRMPENARDLAKIFERVHKSIASPSLSDRNAIEIQKKKIQTASLGSGGKGGIQRSSSLESFNSDKVYALRSGGFSDEEILKILNKTE